MRIYRLNLVCIICIATMCLFVCACDNNAPPQEDPPALNISARIAAAQNADTGDEASIKDAAEENDIGDIDNFEVENDKLYSGISKIDLFLPLIKADAAAEDDDEKKRAPQTPLERFDIGQLKLSAVVEAADGNSAIIVESSGRGYVVKHGYFIGLNNGQITEIKSDRVVIEEPMGKNERGETKYNIIELILPKPAGAF